jgi:hypothetical protein
VIQPTLTFPGTVIVYDNSGRYERENLWSISYTIEVRDPYHKTGQDKKEVHKKIKIGSDVAYSDVRIVAGKLSHMQDHHAKSGRETIKIQRLEMLLTQAKYPALTA